jgi:hypothetical protein
MGQLSADLDSSLALIWSLGQNDQQIDILEVRASPLAREPKRMIRTGLDRRTIWVVRL